MKILKLSTLIVLLSWNALGNSNNSPLGREVPTVEQVDLDSYLGSWFEIYRIENSFQDDEPAPGEGPCFNTTAEYTTLPKGKIRVKNTCYRRTKSEVAQAKAYAVPGSQNAKLKVNFTGVPFLEWLGIGDGDYWILALGVKNQDDQYSWALVGSPNLDYGWILSRTETLPSSDLEKAFAAALHAGYSTSRFKSFRR